MNGALGKGGGCPARRCTGCGMLIRGTQADSMIPGKNGGPVPSENCSHSGRPRGEEKLRRRKFRSDVTEVGIRNPGGRGEAENRRALEPMPLRATQQGRDSGACPLSPACWRHRTFPLDSGLPIALLGVSARFPPLFSGERGQTARFPSGEKRNSGGRSGTPKSNISSIKQAYTLRKAVDLSIYAC